MLLHPGPIPDSEQRNGSKGAAWLLAARSVTWSHELLASGMCHCPTRQQPHLILVGVMPATTAQHSTSESC